MRRGAESGDQSIEAVKKLFIEFPLIDPLNQADLDNSDETGQKTQIIIRCHEFSRHPTSSKPELTFTEFLEMICRLSLYYTDPRLSRTLAPEEQGDPRIYSAVYRFLHAIWQGYGPQLGDI